MNLIRDEVLIISIVVVFLLVFSMPSLAKSEDEDALSIPSIRSLSMGSAFTAVADDEDILFYNPAGLAFLEDSRLTAVGFQVNFNIDAISANSELISEGGFSDSESISKNSIDKLKGFNPLLNFAGPAQVTYVRPNYAFSFLNLQTKFKMDFEYWDNKSNILLHSRSDTLAMIAYGRQVYRGLAVGLAVKYLLRSDIEAEDMSSEKGTIFIKHGLGFDIGLMYPLEKWGLKVGAALKDVANTNLTSEKRKLDGFDKLPKTPAAKIKQNFALGVSYQPRCKIPHKRFAYLPHNLIFSADIGSGDSFSDSLRLGMELKLYRWLAFRLGVHSGVQLGLGMRTKTLAVDYMFAPKIKDPFVGEETDNNHYFSLISSY